MKSISQIIEFEGTRKSFQSKSKNTSTKLVVHLVLALIYLVAVTIFSIIIAMFRILVEKKPTPKYFIHSLSNDQIYSLDGSDRELFDFLRERRFDFSENKQDYLVACSKKKCFRKEYLRKTKNITFFLLSNCLDTKALINFISLNWRNALNLFNHKSSATISSERLIRIYFEYFVWKIVELPNDATFVSTQSSLSSLPVVFYMNRNDLCRKMMWYSTNNKPIKEVKGKEVKLPDFTELSSFVDMHLVWEETDSNFLSSLGVHNTKVVGSVMFYPKKLKKKLNGKITITYFDVTPFDNFRGFLSEDMLIKNLLGITKVIDALKISKNVEIIINIKPKRTYIKSHAKEYIKIIKNISSKENINLLPSRTNLYELISESDFVLAVPFTSPALIGRELGIPTAYVCLLPRNYVLQDVNNIQVIRSEKDLFDFLS